MHLMIKNLIDQFDLVDLDHIHDDMGSKQVELDPVGSTVRYEMMKLCTG